MDGLASQSSHINPGDHWVTDVPARSLSHPWSQFLNAAELNCFLKIPQ